MATRRPDASDLLNENANRLMQKKQVSLSYLADRCGISDKTLYNILHGKHSPTLGKVDSLARALGVPIYELFTTKDSVLQSNSDDFFNSLGDLTEGEKVFLSEFVKDLRGLKGRYLDAGSGEWNKKERQENEDRRKKVIQMANQKDKE